jgi:hypothetical protein
MHHKSLLSSRQCTRFKRSRNTHFGEEAFFQIITVSFFACIGIEKHPLCMIFTKGANMLYRQSGQRIEHPFGTLTLEEASFPRKDLASFMLTKLASRRQCIKQLHGMPLFTKQLISAFQVPIKVVGRGR